MADEHGGQALSRNPTVDDLALLCGHLNEAEARYVVIGGFAMIYHGLVRGTMDIDLLVDPHEDNITKVKKALEYLPDKAVRDLRLRDIQEYTVVRVADEVIVDVMGAAAGITFAEVRNEMEHATINGVSIPYLSARALLRTKQTLRADDAADRIFLERLLRSKDDF